MGLSGKEEFRNLHLWRDVGVEFVATFMLMAAQATLPLQWGGNTGFGSIVQVCE